MIALCYRDFLLRSADPDEREYTDPSDQIREVLIHEHYLSQRDIECCLRFDPDTLRERDDFEQIDTLHRTLGARFASAA